jgi:hypothetical protein
MAGIRRRRRAGKSRTAQSLFSNRLVTGSLSRCQPHGSLAAGWQAERHVHIVRVGVEK